MKRPIIISGPCSAETEEQTIATCTRLAETKKVDILRAGIWKPRTSPESFEGVGELGLIWFENAKRITGLPIAVEVANAEHVHKALAHGVDYVWIGARTTVNPFNVKEIAHALKGAKIKVLIKNPINPDLSLWSGAIERIAHTLGIENIWLVHRGFSAYGYSEYRNVPLWHLVFDIRRQFPETKIICDPSHICGNRENLLKISQIAADLNYDGLMIESHIYPNAAWSDANQQITPDSLNILLKSLKWRDVNSNSSIFSYSLNSIRSEIDQIDSDLFELLSRRMKLAEEIGRVKLTGNVSIYQEQRWKSIVERIMSRAKRLNLNEAFIHSILEIIHAESINRQNTVMNKTENI
ncbi:MAG: bifunctional 3-deoxy-7-phosphoheptulonate synthase/chorismate mutase type II [Prevotellaceae bacterium]|jgi:chorismate mutase|nr:bifunctional 3-deoxy-7-phosphoheptulonate synthase/chorismate mutase type II [Prevotellaceae bacterium]